MALAAEEDLALLATGRAMRSAREAALRLLAATIDGMSPSERVRHLAALAGEMRQVIYDIESSAE